METRAPAYTHVQPRRLLPLALLCAISIVVSGCGSGSGPASLGQIGAGPHLTALQRSDPFGAFLRRSRNLGPARPHELLTFLIQLRDPTSRHQAADLAAMYDPHSPRFGHFESVRQWESRYGPPRAAVQRARTWLRRVGFSTQWHRGDSWMLVRGAVRAIDSVFRVQVRRYRARSGTRFEASMADPTIPRALSAIVVGSGHITTLVDRTRQVTPADGLTPTDVIRAYNLTPLRNAHLDGAGQTVAFIEIDGFRQSDLDAFTSRFNLPAMHPRIVAGPTLRNVEGETDLDLQVVHEIAPAAKLTVYNCSNPCSDASIASMESAAIRNTPGGIISISLGGCEWAEGRTAAGAERSAFDKADALGETVFVASGDSGAFTCLTENWGAAPTSRYLGASMPASVPGVTGVGGTRLSLRSNGSWYREEVWENPLDVSGSGGGLSTYFQRPAWQQAPGVENAYSSSGARQVPDISAVADPTTSAIVNVGGSFVQAGGTSQAAPVWAGMMALVNQYLKRGRGHSAGFLNPALYALARNPAPYQPFHDVTTGTNLKYPATPGYDMASGLGTPNAWNLARDLQRYLRGGAR